MERFSLSARPGKLERYRKATTVELAFVSEEFIVETQEGNIKIAPHVVEGWEGGYYVAYPSDGSKPYAIAPGFVRDNYVRAGE